MDINTLLNVCLQVTGTFEGGTPKYDALAGNFDGAGISVGVLQWNAGQGTLQQLVKAIGAAMGWDKAKTFFHSDIEQFASLDPAAAIAFAKAHYLDDTNPSRLAPAAHDAWSAFLLTPESVAAQQALATSTTLAHAQRLAAQYVPQAADRIRSIAFFFDLVNQQGSMMTVQVADGDGVDAISFAGAKDQVCAGLWADAAATDALTRSLLHYAYARAVLGKPEYVWDSLSRRGTIAARKGVVHGSRVDLTGILD